MADYRKCNPKIAVGLDSGGQPIPMGVEFPIYQEDGSSNPITLPTNEELLSMAKAVLAAMPSKDVRMIYHVLTEMAETIDGLIINTINSHHHFIHSSTPVGFDEDTLCTGLKMFLENVLQPSEGKVTAQNSEEYVLQTFFTGDKKPN